jgi:hypothetical protein
VLPCIGGDARVQGAVVARGEDQERSVAILRFVRALEPTQLATLGGRADALRCNGRDDEQWLGSTRQ